MSILEVLPGHHSRMNARSNNFLKTLSIRGEPRDQQARKGFQSIGVSASFPKVMQLQMHSLLFIIASCLAASIPPSPVNATAVQDLLSETISLPDSSPLDQVREMVKHAWSGYRKFAWGDDELMPLSQKGRNWSDFGYLFTPVDALDTLYITGLLEEYKDAKDLVLNRLDIDQPSKQSQNHFEINIRVLGGLLSAFTLDQDPRFLKMAINVADRLLVAFDSASGLPPQSFSMETGKGKGGTACLASVGTLQLEMQYLSDLTGNLTYQKKALAVYDVLEEMNRGMIPGLFPDSLYVGTSPPQFTGASRYTVGANADSFYEYLLKLFVTTGDDRFGRLYDQSLDAILHNMLATKNTSVFLPDLSFRGGESVLDDHFQHLACFTGGMLSLGAKSMNQDKPEAAQHFQIGQKITETCMRSYQESSNGLGGEVFQILEDGSTLITNPSIILRPEVVESVFYHWRYTKDQKYRDFGVDMIKNLNKYARTDAGFSALDRDNEKTDNMESFFFAETLKYLFLLFSDDSVISLDDYVFNTECHPFSRRGKGINIRAI